MMDFGFSTVTWCLQGRQIAKPLPAIIQRHTLKRFIATAFIGRHPAPAPPLRRHPGTFKANATTTIRHAQPGAGPGLEQKNPVPRRANLDSGAMLHDPDG
jgi:hypothetical protein